MLQAPGHRRRQSQRPRLQARELRRPRPRTGVPEGEEGGVCALVPPDERHVVGDPGRGGAGVDAHADDPHSLLGQDGDGRPGEARHVPLAQQQLGGQPKGCVQAVAQLHPRRQEGWVVDLGLGVEGEGVPYDVAPPHRPLKGLQGAGAVRFRGVLCKSQPALRAGVWPRRQPTRALTAAASGQARPMCAGQSK